MRRYFVLTAVSLACLTAIGLNGSDGTAKAPSPSCCNRTTGGPLFQTGQSKVNLHLAKDSAVKIAEIILPNIYGEKVLKQRPWIVTDNGASFTIRGTFHHVTSCGGVAEITIAKADAQVIHYTHGK